MKSYCLALAALAAIGFAGAAYAGDQPISATTAAAPKAMTDEQMDRVTAGQCPVGCIQTKTQVVEPNWSVNNQAGEHGFQGSHHAAQCLGCVTISDIRLKRDIEQVARLDNGLALYRYRYKWSDQVYVGVMAQEVALVRPDAVVRGADGYLRVNYGRLGLHLMTWEEWVASRPLKTAENAKRTGSAPTAMSDSEMDRVTAAGQPSLLGRGLDTASRTPAADTNWANRPNNPPDQRGIGRCTAIFAQGGICGP
jgi:hypothetical protein